MKTYTLEEVTDIYIGKKGTPKREQFETELRLDTIAYAIKQAREESNLTQEQLGELIGVQKSQISILESDLKGVSFELVLKVFKALNSKISFKIELTNGNLNLV
ncbi:helix-turn-helix domain-containing protein [Bernardetia sp. OM2101]|uniref:helix-turn-helix domain-containing protein n=1 Tax=Bernardetia sp. OM2101 TaxID=3344876 RepID=UPI0035D047B9